MPPPMMPDPTTPTFVKLIEEHYRYWPVAPVRYSFRCVETIAVGSARRTPRRPRVATDRSRASSGATSSSCRRPRPSPGADASRRSQLATLFEASRRHGRGADEHRPQRRATSRTSRQRIREADLVVLARRLAAAREERVARHRRSAKRSATRRAWSPSGRSRRCSARS